MVESSKAAPCRKVTGLCLLPYILGRRPDFLHKNWNKNPLRSREFWRGFSPAFYGKIQRGWYTLRNQEKSRYL